ncbi:MAG: 50S ribosomal protein L24 [Proteobacteria bacterium]|jgi:large subunit ribosomal protein L24|nr:MAG: 50S ribosomal protein L24 [Pseudomonadota bacterium]|tara:strand:- start:29 stop:334 length:306 start_codon:yes stop_codon:yes gene_type:complete
MAARIKTGDNVVVTAGKDKGKTGVVKLVKDDRIVVEGVNLVKKHQKATPLAEAAMVTKEASIHASNVMLADPETGKPTRVGFKVEEGKKVRVAKASGKTVA